MLRCRLQGSFMDINLCLPECARAVLLFRIQRDEWPDKSLELCELQSSHTTRVVNYDINVYYYACLSEEDHISGGVCFLSPHVLYSALSPFDDNFNSH